MGRDMGASRLLPLSAKPPLSRFIAFAKTITGFHTSGAWVESVYYGINNTRPIYSERVHRALQILKFRVNWANIEQDTAIQTLQNLQRNVWISGQVSAKCMEISGPVSGNPYICY